MKVQARLEAYLAAAGSTLPLRCARRFADIRGRDRSMVMAGQAFITLIPLFIIGAAAASDAGAADALVRRFHLRGEAADAVRLLFSRPPGSSSVITLVSAVFLLASLISFTRIMQGTYEAAFDLPPVGFRGTLIGLGGVAVLITQVLVLAVLAGWLGGIPAGSALGLVARALFAVPIWVLLQWLLLTRRVHWRRLVPGAVVTAVGQVLLSQGSALWMPTLVERNAVRYGVVGVTFALVSWLIVMGVGVVVGAVVSAELAAAGRGPE